MCVFSQYFGNKVTFYNESSSPPGHLSSCWESSIDIKRDSGPMYWRLSAVLKKTYRRS